MRIDRLVILLIIFSTLMACETNNGNGAEPELSESSAPSDRISEKIIGRWQKTNNSDCDQTFPDELEFLEGGIYNVPLRDDVFYVWQGGDYEWISENEIRIMTANDAMLSYRVSMEDGSLTFDDNADCTTTYSSK